MTLPLSACNTESKSINTSNLTDIVSCEEISHDDEVLNEPEKPSNSQDVVESTDSSVAELPEQSTKPQEKPSTPDNIPYDISHLCRAIEVFNNYRMYGAACGYDHMTSVGYEEIDPYITVEQRELVYSLYPDINPLENCHTTEEERKHLEQYLAVDIDQRFDSKYFVKYNNKLYIMRGAMGYVNFEHNISESDITRVAHNKISVKTELYGSNGDFSNYARIDFEYQNGAYKIVKESDI